MLNIAPTMVEDFVETVSVCEAAQRQDMSDRIPVCVTFTGVVKTGSTSKTTHNARTCLPELIGVPERTCDRFTYAL